MVLHLTNVVQATPMAIPTLTLVMWKTRHQADALELHLKERRTLGMKALSRDILFCFLSIWIISLLVVLKN